MLFSNNYFINFKRSIILKTSPKPASPQPQKNAYFCCIFQLRALLNWRHEQNKNKKLRTY